jgi:hypothetical protein
MVKVIYDTCGATLFGPFNYSTSKTALLVLLFRSQIAGVASFK